MSIQNTLLTTGTSNVFVSTGNVAITTAYFCNNDAIAQNFTVYAIPAGGTPSITNCIYANVQLASGDTYVMDAERLILGTGDTLRASATANSVISVTVSSLGI